MGLLDYTNPFVAMVNKNNGSASKQNKLAALLNTSYSGMQGQAPRMSDRQMPSEPLNYRGLLDAATNIPVVGDALSGGMAIYDAAKGDYPSAAMNALGVLPFVSGTFIGKSAKTWDAVKAAEAEKRLAAGDDARKVWKETGTFKGPDGHLRQEIDDSNAFYRGSKAAGSSYAEDVMLHPSLYNNYPSLSNNRIIESNAPGGSYDESLGRITVGPTDANSTMLHELQHAIQGKEGWAKGGSPESMVQDVYDAKESFNKYNRLRQQAYDAASDKAKYMVGLPENAELVKQAMAKYEPTLGIKTDSNPFGVDKETALKWLLADQSGANRYADLANKSRYLSTLDPHDAYKHLAGEAEARATQSRMNMNMDQRLNTYPLDSYDVPINQLIFRGGLLGR